MAGNAPRRRLPLLLTVLACLCLGGLWVASFFATGLLWWRASDLYEAPVARPDVAVAPGSLEEAFEQREASATESPGP